MSALLIALLAPHWASSASAARQWSPLVVSHDGQRWSQSLSRALFGDVALVPGDREVRSFYVKNQGPSHAYLRVSIVMQDPQRWAATKHLRMAVGIDGKWRRVTSTGQRTHRLRIPQGGVQRVQVRFRSPADGGNWGRLRTLDFDVKLRLTHRGKVTLK